MVRLLDLPNELLVLVLVHVGEDVRQLARVAGTCRRLRAFVYVRGL